MSSKYYLGQVSSEDGTEFSSLEEITSLEESEFENIGIVTDTQTQQIPPGIELPEDRDESDIYVIKDNSNDWITTDDSWLFIVHGDVSRESLLEQLGMEMEEEEDSYPKE